MSKTPQETPKKDPRLNLRRGGFEKEQPSPQAKSAGRDRRRQAQNMMDMILEYQSMTKADLEKLSQKKDLTVLQLLMIKYVVSGMKDNKMLVDMIDRHVSKAPAQQEIEMNSIITQNIVKIGQKPQQ